MKKIIFLMFASLITMTASAENLVEKIMAAAAYEPYCSVAIYFQLPGSCNDVGSTVTYIPANGSGYVTEKLRVISNFINVKKGTYMEINLLIMSGGVIYATGYNPSFCPIPITNGYGYTFVNTSINNEIYITIDDKSDIVPNLR